MPLGRFKFCWLKDKKKSQPCLGSNPNSESYASIVSIISFHQIVQPVKAFIKHSSVTKTRNQIQTQNSTHNKVEIFTNLLPFNPQSLAHLSSFTYTRNRSKFTGSPNSRNLSLQRYQSYSLLALPAVVLSVSSVHAPLAVLSNPINLLFTLLTTLNALTKHERSPIQYVNSMRGSTSIAIHSELTISIYTRCIR